VRELDALVDRLTTLTELDGAWSISSDEVLALLGVDPVVFWRAIHRVRDRIGFADAIDGWTQDTAGDLVTVLEGMYGSPAEARLTGAGLFVPWVLGVELLEELLSRAQRFSAAHELRTEELAAMLRHAGTVRGAVEIYLDEYADLEALIDGCADSFRVLKDLPPAAAVTAAAWLRRMDARHLFAKRGLLAGLEERLRLAAALLGYVDPDDRPRGARAAGAEEEPRVSRRRRWALGVMGLSPRDCTADDLRARYRQLMMRYHPDADPTGLERCKDVNVAYSLLIAEAGAPGNHRNHPGGPANG
jgi:hypothetical protein